MDELRRRKARIRVAIDVVLAAGIHPDGCLNDEWGCPLPGDADAIESWATMHEVSFVVHAMNENARLVRLCDNEEEVRIVIRYWPTSRFGGTSLEVGFEVHLLGKIVPGTDGHHYDCIPTDVTDRFE